MEGVYHPSYQLELNAISSLSLLVTVNDPGDTPLITGCHNHTHYYYQCHCYSRCKITRDTRFVNSVHFTK